ncbi:MAG TPA: phytanoyl-CoA dioxygenase family protein [Panacibacter sp.]|nr:phytanoyl-CoA dioxygenase family protein [Panacibacter sp.]HNP44447.1 phytanoyl-CoA dioxygenase family protein [Panacibacter sp.]
MKQLSARQLKDFIDHGFIKIDNAFSPSIASECRAILWEVCQCDPHDTSTWTRPVIRIPESGLEPFKHAANNPTLHNAFDQLAGKGNWLPKESLGSFPIRFPHKTAATDTGWHVDASFPGEVAGDYLQWRINIYSKGRALLMLFLFSDVSEKDAPTVIKTGSHFDVARLLAPAADKGLSFFELAQQLPSLPERPLALATGNAGTVYLCHPFIVHAAQDHHGTNPRFMAQPALHAKQNFNIDPAKKEHCPVEQAIIRALYS